MKSFKIIFLIAVAILSPYFSNGERIVLNLVFSQTQVELSEKHYESLEDIIAVWNQYDNSSHTKTLQIEGRTADMADYSSDKEQFQKRAIAIRKYFYEKGIADKNAVLEAFLFSKDLSQVKNVNDDILASQLVRIIFTVETLKEVSQRKQKAQQRTLSLRRNVVREDNSDTLKIRCNPLNRAYAVINCNQHLSITTQAGIEIFIPKGSIQKCEQNLEIYINIQEAVDIPALRNKFRAAKVGKKGLRLAGYLYLGIGTKKEMVKVKGTIYYKLPIPEIESPQLLFSKSTRIAHAQSNASFKVEKPERYELKYQNGFQELVYTTDFAGSTNIAIGRITEEMTILSIEDKLSKYAYKKDNYYERPAVIYSDSTVTILPSISTARYGMHGFYDLPIFKEEGLTSTLKATYTTIDNSPLTRNVNAMLPELQIFVLEEEINMSFDRKGQIKNTKKKRIKGRKKPVYQGINTKFTLVLFRPKVLDKDPTKDH